jgi:hypothetical protein
MTHINPLIFEKSKAQVDFTYTTGGKQVKYKNELILPGQPFADKCVQLNIKFDRHTDQKGYILTMSIKALEDIKLAYLELNYMADLQNLRMLAHGFQSWSQARELTKNDRIPAIKSPVAWYTQLNLQG